MGFMRYEMSVIAVGMALKTLEVNGRACRDAAPPRCPVNERLVLVEGDRGVAAGEAIFFFFLLLRVIFMLWDVML